MLMLDRALTAVGTPGDGVPPCRYCTRANNVDITEAGGWIVVLFAVLAWYHAAGDVIESTFGRKVLPFGPPPIK